MTVSMQVRHKGQVNYCKVIVELDYRNYCIINVLSNILLNSNNDLFLKKFIVLDVRLQHSTYMV